MIDSDQPTLKSLLELLTERSNGVCVKTFRDLLDPRAPRGYTACSYKHTRYAKPTADFLYRKTSRLKKLSVRRRKRHLRVLQTAISDDQAACARCHLHLEATHQILQLILVESTVGIQHARRLAAFSKECICVLLCMHSFVHRSSHELELREPHEPVANTLPMNDVFRRPDRNRAVLIVGVDLTSPPRQKLPSDLETPE